MNNTTFGDESCGYYETVAGGAGAVSCFVQQCQHASENEVLELNDRY